MDKTEIQKEIDQANLDIYATNQRISRLREELAERPKRRHGDFGFEDSYLRLITNPANKTGLTISNEYGEISPGSKITTVYGNIFDLLKEWSEDLTFFAFDVHHCEINTVEFSHAPIHIAGNWHTLSEAEEIWHKLGRVIATLKRKQS